LHLVANPGVPPDQERENNSQNSSSNRDGEASPVSDALVDLELISGLIRTLSNKENNNFSCLHSQVKQHLIEETSEGGYYNKEQMVFIWM